MEETTVATSSSSVFPCSWSEASVRSDDCIEDTQLWEKEVFLGIRVWQFAAIVLSILLTIIVGLCCCIRFRVPRTKQEIEADYIRKKITRKFRRELSKINNKDMDEMDLQKALDRIRNEFDGDPAIAKECAEMAQRNAQRGFRSRFNAVFGGTRVRFSSREQAEFSAMI
ncbi:hypothetical protein DMN91_006732 [Ooceraea biroi]|uniref:Transmembrane inner ear expressed protein n=1 Tax=Ooceraea biroi TaxID=2015173 RepID=A0A026WEZ5_OOCBI|nr:transmembrane inner ear expressed protein [Ooceraea biroi]EZA54602.1 Transmembrane inner ear expressed protein [Ooceraea biroi]RLU20126.1 hypothetical protein DMN91_006732 [Ooceraea biroi]